MADLMVTAAQRSAYRLDEGLERLIHNADRQHFRPRVGLGGRVTAKNGHSAAFVAKHFAKAGRNAIG